MYFILRVKSKISFFLLFLLQAFFFLSCGKENEIIPDVIVDFYIDVNDPRFASDLNTIGGAIMVNENTMNEPYAAGFGGSGIIIAYDGSEYYAYDRTCPHDYLVDGSVIRVDIDQTGFAKAVCPKCRSSFELIIFGTPAPGSVSQYPLKNYRTTFDGRYIRVWNN